MEIPYSRQPIAPIDLQDHLRSSADVSVNCASGFVSSEHCAIRSVLLPDCDYAHTQSLTADPLMIRHGSASSFPPQICDPPGFIS